MLNFLNFIDNKSSSDQVKDGIQKLNLVNYKLFPLFLHLLNLLFSLQLRKETFVVTPRDAIGDRKNEAEEVGTSTDLL
jgi:hypothetical protein